MQDRINPARAVLALALFLFAGLAICGAAAAQIRDQPEAGTAVDGEAEVTLVYFWSRTCPHCAKARPFLDALETSLPWLTVEPREVTESSENRALFAAMAKSVGEEIRGVPTFFLCDRMIVGFDAPNGVGARLRALAESCHAALIAKAEPSTAVLPPAPDISLPLFGTLDLGALSLPAVTVILGGLDAFNPCAFFVLLFLLSLLVHARSRRRMALIGGIFVVFSGLVYFAFMAAWLNLFFVLEGVRLVTTIAGAVAVVVAAINIKDFFLFKKGVTLSIPEHAKPGLFARMRGLATADRLPALVSGTVALAIAANTYELLCTSGFPLVYTRILTLEALSTASYYAYLALYNAVYVMPLLAIVAVFTATLGARKLTEAQGRALKLLSGLMMLGLGLILIIAPDALDNVLTAVSLLAAAAVFTVVLHVAKGGWRRRHPEAGR